MRVLLVLFLPLLLLLLTACAADRPPDPGPAVGTVFVVLDDGRQPLPV